MKYDAAKKLNNQVDEDITRALRKDKRTGNVIIVDDILPEVSRSQVAANIVRAFGNEWCFGYCPARKDKE